MTFVSYAQNYEDVMLWRALQHISPGFYIDVGAAWPATDSVTEAFYQRGWYGINVEPNPDLFSQLNSKRSRDINLQLAISAQDGEAEISIIKDTGLSTLRKDIAEQHTNQGWSCSKINVITKTLSSLWKLYVPEGQDVHFLKLDVEGYEEPVIESNNWAKNRPWIVVIESTLPLSQVENYSLWQSKLLHYDYEFVYADGLNRFYLANEHSNLKSHFTYPPNYFDGFQLASQRRIEAEFDKIEAELNSVEDLNQHLKIEISALKAELYLLANSRSMRITKPLRSLLSIAKQLRYWVGSKTAEISKKNFSNKVSPSAENNKRIFASKAFLLLIHFHKKFFRKALNRLFLTMYKNPKVNGIVKIFSRRVPHLESTLRRIYTRAIYSSSVLELNAYPKELAHLSPTARQIYFDLKKAIDKQHGKDH